jgi:HK97 gp10 family phage protein
MEEVGRQLKMLPGVVKERIARGAVLAGAKVVRDEARSLVPVKTGLLRDNIRTAKRTRGVPYTMVRYVTFVKGGKRPGRRKGRDSKGTNRTTTQKWLPYYWYWVEFGTSKMAARSFMIRAFTSHVQAAANASRDYAQKRAARELKKLARKG